MRRTYERRRSRTAVWSRRLALFFVAVLLLAVALHRFSILSTPPALATIATCWAMLAASLMLGAIGLMRVWSQGVEGLRDAVIGIMLSAASLALPVYLTIFLFQLPQMNDITTDLEDPPPFSAALSLRPPSANAVRYGGAETAAQQERFYPDIRPYRSALGVEETYEAVRQVVERSGWHMEVQSPPLNDTSVAGIEAVATSRIMGFADDIAIRVTPGDDGTFVDIRSASRYGKHDLGANAARVRKFLLDLREEIAPTAGGER